MPCKASEGLDPYSSPFLSFRISVRQPSLAPGRPTSSLGTRLSAKLQLRRNRSAERVAGFSTISAPFSHSYRNAVHAVHTVHTVHGGRQRQRRRSRARLASTKWPVKCTQN